MLGQPAARVAVGDEADVVRVRLVGHAQPACCGLGADLRLGGRGAEREHRVRELVGGEHAQHVGLVLGPGARPVQLAVAVGVRQNARVVPGADGVEAEVERLLQQRGELDPLVAAHARVGSAAGRVLGDEVVHDVELEALGEVPDVVRDADDVRCALRIHRVLDRATAAAAGAQGAGHARQRQMHTDHVVTGLDGTRRRHRGVDSPAHRRQNLHPPILPGVLVGALSGRGGRGARRDRRARPARRRRGAPRAAHPHPPPWTCGPA